jgi:hypothetical protein
MLPNIRPSGFGVAFKAFQVDVLGVYQLIRDGPVGIMAIRALDLAFAYRMMGLSQQLRCDRPMTVNTDFGLAGFSQIFGMLPVNIVAIGTGKSSYFMFTGVPHGDFTLAVTLQTNRVLFFGCFRRLRAEPQNIATFAFFSVGRPRPMTGLANEILAASGRCSRVSFDAMNIFPKVVIHLLMTLQAGFITDKIFFILTAVGAEGYG